MNRFSAGFPSRPARARGRAHVAFLTVWGILALISSGCAGHPTADSDLATLQGRVSLEGKGLPGADVYLMPLQYHLEPETQPAARTIAGAEGTFRLDVSPGSYLLFARDAHRFSFFGRNPVRVRTDITGLHLPLARAYPVSRITTEPGTERLEGRVFRQGSPVEGALVFVYLDPSRGLRGPGYAVSGPTDAQGNYTLPLPPGTYFVVTRMRSDGRWRSGTLAPGDLFGALPEMPVILSAGEAVRADLETVAIPSREQMARYEGQFTRVAGRIVDGQGRPAAGVRACLYTNSQLLERPVAVSEPTGYDGLFVIESSLTGPHYLGAREFLGGPPAPGERVGFYRGEEGALVRLPAGGALNGLEVVVQEVP